MPDKTISLDKMVDLLFQFGEAQGIEISYKAIERATGVVWNNVRKIRLGENDNPSLGTIQAIADYFGVKLDYFNCRTEEECRDYLGVLAEKRIAGQIEDTEVKMRSKGISFEGMQTLQAMIDYVKQKEGLVSTSDDNFEHI